ncbi:unnamed protein product [Trichogramma brassicae]|uniref:Uncharacterized protein n=1 Tax=Trichogramma brassicae TaxID=86971 RepID=A0A6H5IDR5_9HYME|nr:unnamed protein product [Trichogramma brassicae]
MKRGQCVAILQPRKICASIPGSPVRGHATNKYGPVTKPHIRETSDAPAMCSAKRARLQRRAGESCTATALLCKSLRYQSSHSAHLLAFRSQLACASENLT